MCVLNCVCTGEKAQCVRVFAVTAWGTKFKSKNTCKNARVTVYTSKSSNLEITNKKLIVTFFTSGWMSTPSLKKIGEWWAVLPCPLLAILWVCEYSLPHTLKCVHMCTHYMHMCLGMSYITRYRKYLMSSIFKIGELWLL